MFHRTVDRISIVALIFEVYCLICPAIEELLRGRGDREIRKISPRGLARDFKEIFCGKRLCRATDGAVFRDKKRTIL